MSLPRTSSRASFKLSTLKYIVMPNSKEKQRLKELEANGMQDTPDSELDSGISVNGNYDEPRQKNDPPEIYERIDELQSSEGKQKSKLFCGSGKKYICYGKVVVLCKHFNDHLIISFNHYFDSIVLFEQLPHIVDP